MYELAVTLQLDNCLALTPTLSPGRGDRPLPCWKNSPNVEAAAAAKIGLPLLGGEGRGEGEHFFPLNVSGLELVLKPGSLCENRSAPNFKISSHGVPV